MRNPFDLPLPTLKSWYRASLANRLSLSLLLGLVFVLAVVGGASYLAMSRLLERNIEADLASQEASIASRVEGPLNQLLVDLQHLAQSSFVGNGLADSSGRDIYLVPFLGNFQEHSVLPMRLVLVDFRGKALAAGDPAQPLLSFEHSSHVRTALGSGTPGAALVREQGKLLLEVVQPIFFPPTASIEGALLAQVDIGRFFEGIIEILPPRLFHQLVFAEQDAVGSHGTSYPEDLFVNAKLLALNPPLAQLGIRLELGEARSSIFRPLRLMLMIYLVSGVLLGLFALIFSRRFGAVLARPIVELSHSASQIAAGNGLLPLSSVRRGDEIGALSRALSRMVEKLRQANESLEMRVQERTAELQSSRELLANIVANTPLAVGVREVGGGDDQGAWVHWNSAAEKIFGYDLDTLCHTSFPGSLLPVAIPDEEALPRQEEGWNFETSYRHPQDGRLLTLDTRILGLFDGSGQISHLLAICDDISQRKRYEELILNIARGVAAQTGEGFFQALTEHLGNTLGADSVLIGHLVQEQTAIETAALYVDGEIRGNIVYDLAGTPCECACAEDAEIRSYPERVWQLFPEDHMLREDRIEAYVGAPLKDRAGRLMGILVVLFRHPLENQTQAENLLSIFAARAAAEMERQRSEQALAETRGRFQAIVENAPSGICTVTRQGKLLSANPPLCIMLGFEEAELVNLDLNAIVHPDDGHSFGFDRPRQRPEIPVSLRRECRLLCRDGGFVWVDLALTSGEDFGIIMVRDISRQRMLERTLRLDKLRSEALYQLAQMDAAPKDVIHSFILEQAVRLTDSALGYIFSPDPSGTRLVLHAWSGYRAADGAGKVLQSEFSLDAVGSWGEVIRKQGPVLENHYAGPPPWSGSAAKEFGDLSRYLNVPLVDSGKLGLVLGVANKAEDYDDTDLRHLNLLLDGMWRILKQKQAEELLRNSERRYRSLYQEFQALLTGIPDRITLLDPHLRVVWSNHLDRSDVPDSPAPEAARRPCYEICYQRAEICEDCPPNRAFRSKSMEQGEIETGDGRIWDIRGIPIRGEFGQVVNVIELAQDITARVRAQELSIRTAHLASLGELAAGVAHEINNPINGIINYAQILADRLTVATGEVDLPGRIIREGERISAIVRSLLDFARPQGESKQLVDVTSELQEALALCAAKMAREQIVPRIEIAPGLPGVMSRSGQLRQVFLNILNNSRYALNLKFPGADPDKILDIQVKRIDSDQARLRITVTDFGCGIASDVIDRVMNPFVTTKPLGQGTGLGLSISHGIINDHGGTVKLESVEGHFTKVRIDLPVIPS